MSVRPFLPLLALLLALTVVPLQYATAQLRANEAQAASEDSYQPSESNLKAREWFREARFGIFIHWGVYSELGRGEWVMNNAKMTVDKYKPLAKQFNPTEFDAAEWVSLFKRAGAKYITITSKHHDGFAMWDSKVTDWDIIDATPYDKDVLKALAEECRKQGIKLFFYHSHLDWTHTDYYPPHQTGKHSGRPAGGDFDRYLRFMDSQLAELLGGDYGDVAGIWFDGWWDQRDRKADDPKKTHVDWKLSRTYNMIHKLQPACLIGNNHHVTPFPGEDFQMFERDLPGENKVGYSKDATISSLPLETCGTINKSWGYNAGDQKVKTKRQVLHYLINAAGRDANLLLNVGPKPDGTIQSEFVDRLMAMGKWLDQHGETIYGTRKGPIAPQPWGVSTKRDGKVYLHVLNRPEPDAEGWVTLSGCGDLQLSKLSNRGSQESVEWRTADDGAIAVRWQESMDDPIDTILVATE